MARRWARRSPLASAGALIVGLVIVTALAAPLLATTDPIDQDLSEALKPPFWLGDGSLRHPLGTDHLGRDVYSRLIYGARISLTISVLAALLGALVGVAAGVVAGYLGGRVDMVIMRLADLNLAFPLILLALAVVALLGANLKNLVIVMAITTWMIYARVVRGLSLGLREREFVQAARALGAHDARIIARHVLPNVLAPVMVIWTLEVARIILMESALSFLGLGVPPPTPTWGRMLAEGRDYLTVAGWIAVFPGLAILLTVLGINFLGDGLRDLLDPRLRRQTQPAPRPPGGRESTWARVFRPNRRAGLACRRPPRSHEHHEKRSSVLLQRLGPGWHGLRTLLRSMRILCAWCCRDGQPGYLGEREPFDHPEPTHGICEPHKAQLLEALPSESFPDAELLIIVRESKRALYEHLERMLAGLARVTVIVERRVSHPRERPLQKPGERRWLTTRRLREAASPPSGDLTFVRFTPSATVEQEAAES